MIRPDEIDATLAEYVTARPMTTAEYWIEISGLRQANRALDSQIRGLQHRLEELDGAANTKAHKLEGDVRSWQIAAGAMAAVWLMTLGGLLRAVL